jgi:hypothetical protein
VNRLITLVSLSCLSIAALSRPAVTAIVFGSQEPARPASQQNFASSAEPAARRVASRTVAAPARPAPAPIINAASVKGFEGTVKPFLSEYCYPCHGNKGEPKNGLNLQSFQLADTLIGQRDHWEDVIGMLRRGDMPPMEEEQPEESRRQAVAAWLEDELERIV